MTSVPVPHFHLVDPLPTTMCRHEKFCAPSLGYLESGMLHVPGACQRFNGDMSVCWWSLDPPWLPLESSEPPSDVVLAAPAPIADVVEPFPEDIDIELTVIVQCIEALKVLPSTKAKARIASYLASRYTEAA
jgi:hypothetical protein